jgi:hypothetical protein
MLWILGTLAAVLQVISCVPYIRDILRGTTRPHRGTWIIWCALALIVLASQWADGGRWSLLLVVAQFVGCAVILTLSVPRGVGGASPMDLALLGVAAAGLAGWYLAGDPTIATACVVLADSIAVIMMLPKTYADPYSETLSAYVLSTVSVLLAAAAVGSLDAGLLLYPAYLTTADSILIVLMVVRRRRLATAAGAGRGELARAR